MSRGSGTDDIDRWWDWGDGDVLYSWYREMAVREGQRPCGDSYVPDKYLGQARHCNSNDLVISMCSFSCIFSTVVSVSIYCNPHKFLGRNSIPIFVVVAQLQHPPVSVESE